MTTSSTLTLSSSQSKISHISQNIWLTIGELSVEYDALAIGDGCPNYPPPEFVTQALAKVELDSQSDGKMVNQYTRYFGHPRLVEALSKFYSKLIGRRIDPMKEILVTIGGTNALYSAIQGLVGKGDEVILFQPGFDMYEFMVRLAGGVPVFVQMNPRSDRGAGGCASGGGGYDGDDQSELTWQFDPKELKSKFRNGKTRMILVNSPQNPTGKVWRRWELELVAELCRENDVICIYDEVYEWYVYDQVEHIRMVTLPGMWDRTITVGSFGKVFLATGWKTGWAYGPRALISRLYDTFINSVNVCLTPVQEAAAISLERELPLLGTRESFWELTIPEIQAKRDRIIGILERFNMKVTVPEGAWYIVVDIGPMAERVSAEELDEESTGGPWLDFRFCKWAIKHLQLQMVPMTIFYTDKLKSKQKRHFARICFLRKDETIDQFEQILESFFLSRKRRKESFDHGKFSQENSTKQSDEVSEPGDVEIDN